MSDQEEESTIADGNVAQKYKHGGEVVNRVLKKIIEKCVAGASIKQICIDGDKLILDTVKTVFKKDKEMKRGIAFPVCICVNNCINHYSPLVSDKDTILNDGDVVKIDFGAHLDEFISVIGHTLVVGASKENKVKGRKADVILAAHYAAEAALKLIKPGTQNYTITDMTTKIAEIYKCKPIEGMLSFELKEGIIDGEKAIIQNPTDNQRKEIEKCEFEKHEVYGIDVIISTGEGIGREMESRTTIYKKTEESYSLKLKTSREFLTKVQRSYGTLPFNIRSFDDERKAKMGVVECVTHRLVEPYPVLYEKLNEFVAQFKFTVFVMPKGSLSICGIPIDVEQFESEFTIEDEEIKKLLNSTSAAMKKKKPKKPVVPAKETPPAPVVPAKETPPAPVVPAKATPSATTASA